MKKVVRDGKVAVLVSVDYGAGWSTWNPEIAEQMMFDPEVVQWLEDGKPKFQVPYFEKKYTNCCILGLDDLEIYWIPVGTQFKITEYDGSESVQYFDNVRWITA